VTGLMPGCGYTPERGGGYTVEDLAAADSPCVAARGHVAVGSARTIGVVGLCLGCCHAPGDLLSKLASEVAGQ
jgi:hypothetical protein